MNEQSQDRNTLAAHLGAVVREARKLAALTQADVAERVGVVTEVFGRLERGQLIPSVPHLRKLCHVLRVDANVLLGLEARRSPLWLEAPEVDGEDSPELRRLVRTLRRMDAAQLAVVISTAQALSRHFMPRRDEQAR